MCECLVVLLIAVSHADTLQAVPRLDGRRGFLHRQPVVDGLVALVVQRAVQDALQPEVTVGLLLRWEDGGVERGTRRKEGKRERLRNAANRRRRLPFGQKRED